MAKQPLNKLAIVLGVSVDLVVAVITVIAFVVVMMAMTGDGDASLDEAMSAWMEEPGFLVAEFILSTLPTVLAGFVAGRVAKRDQVRHALWVGVVVVALYAVLTAIPMEGPGEPLWYDLLTLVTTVPAAMAGGYLSIPRRAVTTA